MSKKLPLWFGVYGKEYPIDEPAFFDPDQFEWSEYLREQYPVIKEALAPLMELHNQELQPYFDTVLQDPPLNWKIIGFCFWGKKDKKNLQKYPEIAKILNQIPNLVTCSFNMLEPNSRILPHYGETNAVYRVHLGIEIPAGLPKCGFKVKDEQRAWEEGELLVFLDANKHEAFNNADKRRYVLLLDIMRPEFMHLKRKVCVTSLSVLSLYWVLSKMPKILMKILQKKPDVVPSWLVTVMLFPLKCIWFLLLLKK